MPWHDACYSLGYLPACCICGGCEVYVSTGQDIVDNLGAHRNRNISARRANLQRAGRSGGEGTGRDIEAREAREACATAVRQRGGEPIVIQSEENAFCIVDVQEFKGRGGLRLLAAAWGRAKWHRRQIPGCISGIQRPVHGACRRRHARPILTVTSTDKIPLLNLPSADSGY